ncbi:MAG: hypothetical protein KA198_09975, partial [Chitinophagaceae bacterium]|nr:hypothetical protein [Chitinophagaceae bacterium]
MSLLLFNSTARANNDSTKVKEAPCTFARIGIDIGSLLLSPFQKYVHNYEAQLDIYYRKNIHLIAEGGFGSSKIDNSFIRYNSRNTFVRLGIDQTFFNKEFKGDFDNAFVGLRYGFSRIKRGEASYFIQDDIWGNQTGQINSSSFNAHWIELTGGFRMELVKHVFAGWNIRMKTFLNPKSFEELPPGYVAGYGRGDKNT